MTSIAWDGRYLVADTRHLQEVKYDKEVQFKPEELEWLNTKLREPAALKFSNHYYRILDGASKILIPKRRLYWRGESVRAVAVSGDSGAITAIRKLPRNFELHSVESPTLQRADGELSAIYLIITDKQVVTECADKNSVGQFLNLITQHPLRLFASAGAGSVSMLEGKEPVLSAEDFVNVCCMMGSINGGQVDIWDSWTNTMVRKDLHPFDKTMSITHQFFTTLLKEKRQGGEPLGKQLGKLDTPLYPELFPEQTTQ